MNLTILTSNFNTNHQTPNLLKSLVTVVKDLPKAIVINTSTVPECELPLQFEGIPYYNFRGGIHGEAVNLGLRKVKTRYVLLVDSDVIFLKDFFPAFERFKETGCALMGKVTGDCGGKLLYPRVEPWYCFMDLHQLKAHKIEFFDRERSKKSKSEERVYDIGSTLFEDIEKFGLTIADVDLEGKYFKHYGGMSWHTQKFNPNDVDTDIDFGGTHPHKGLADYGTQIKRVYDQETEYLKDVNIRGAFSYE